MGVSGKDEGRRDGLLWWKEGSGRSEGSEGRFSGGLPALVSRCV